MLWDIKLSNVKHIPKLKYQFGNESKKKYNNLRILQVPMECVKIDPLVYLLHILFY